MAGGRPGLVAAWIAVLATGCGAGPVQCAPCPPPAYVEVTTGDGAPPTALVGGSVQICVQGLPCETRPFSGGTVSFATPTGTDLRKLDRRSVTATVSSAADGRTLQASGMLAYHHGTGECGCTGVSAQLDLG